jgi:hypothetical protein
MSLRFLIDENLLDRLSRAVTRHNAGDISPLDAVQVGDIPDLPRGSDDPEILLWAEREERILLSFDLSVRICRRSQQSGRPHDSSGLNLRFSTFLRLLRVPLHRSEGCHKTRHDSQQGKTSATDLVPGCVRWGTCRPEPVDPGVSHYAADADYQDEELHRRVWS